MKLKWTSSNKVLLKFLISLLIIGFIIGIFVYTKQPSVIKESISSELSLLDVTLKESKQNNFIYHLVLFSIIIVLSLSVIGVPILIFYLFYEGLGAGFLSAGFFKYKKVTGFFYSNIFLIINKLLYFLVIIYIIVNSINYSRKIIVSFSLKDRLLQDHLFIMFIKNIFALIVILLYDLFLYYLGNKILAYFLFLL